MNRNIKALGLAFAAMLCMGAVAASAASAQGVLTSDGPVTLTGEETGTLFQNSFTGEAGNITCEGSTYTGHKYNETPHELIESGESTATITPHYNQENCQAHTFFNLITLPATVTMNGCDYVFHVGDETGGAGTYGVTADLVCPTGHDVEIHIYEEAPHTIDNEVCHDTIKPQTGLSGPHLTNDEGHVDLVGTFTGIHEEYEGSACGEGTNEEAELHVDVTISGDNGAGEPTPISISG
jgi:hypothetical protein